MMKITQIHIWQFRCKHYPKASQLCIIIEFKKNIVLEEGDTQCIRIWLLIYSCSVFEKYSFPLICTWFSTCPKTLLLSMLIEKNNNLWSPHCNCIQKLICGNPPRRSYVSSKLNYFIEFLEEIKMNMAFYYWIILVLDHT